jgi:hypothetical protein
MNRPTLSMAGQSVLVNTVLNALPTYYMQVFRLPQGIIDRIISCTRRFLWRGDKSFSEGHCLIGWQSLTLPKNRGGIGIIDLRAHNETLLLRLLWALHTEPDSPWVLKLWTQLRIHTIYDLSLHPSTTSYFILQHSCHCSARSSTRHLLRKESFGYSQKTAHTPQNRLIAISSTLEWYNVTRTFHGSYAYQVRLSYSFGCHRETGFSQIETSERGTGHQETESVLCSTTMEEDADHLFFYYRYAQRIWYDILPTIIPLPITSLN